MIHIKSIVSQHSDGVLYSDKKFDWGHSGRDAGVANSTGSVGQVLTSHKDSINRYFRNRTFFYFDTSVIPPDAIIIKASLGLWGHQTAIANAMVVAQKGTQGSPLNITDFQNFTGPEYGHTAWKANAYNVINFNAQGIADINLAGLTKICCREYEHDFLNVPPQEGEELSASFYLSEVENPALFPHLHIEYELPELPECRFNIQDTLGQVIAGAAVTVHSQGSTSTGITDNNGCITLYIPLNTVCDISVTKGYYKTYQGKVISLLENQLNDTSKNFVIKVVNSTGLPLANVNVVINSSIHTDTGMTDTNGLFEGRIETNYANDLIIEKPGFSIYQQQFNKFPVGLCETVGIRLASVITLQ